MATRTNIATRNQLHF